MIGGKKRLTHRIGDGAGEPVGGFKSGDRIDGGRLHDDFHLRGRRQH